MPETRRGCHLEMRDERHGGGMGGSETRGGRRIYGRDRRGTPKAKAAGTDEVRVGNGMADLRLIEQLVDKEQVTAIARLVAVAASRGLLDGGLTSTEIARQLVDEIERDGWEAVLGCGSVGSGLALPRPHELAATLNRWR